MHLDHWLPPRDRSPGALLDWLPAARHPHVVRLALWRARATQGAGGDSLSRFDPEMNSLEHEVARQCRVWSASLIRDLVRRNVYAGLEIARSPHLSRPRHVRALLDAVDYAKRGRFPPFGDGLDSPAVPVVQALGRRGLLPQNDSRLLLASKRFLHSPDVPLYRSVALAGPHVTSPQLEEVLRRDPLPDAARIDVLNELVRRGGDGTKVLEWWVQLLQLSPRSALAQIDEPHVHRVLGPGCVPTSVLARVFGSTDPDHRRAVVRRAEDLLRLSEA